jgi:anti-anti-sigma factor
MWTPTDMRVVEPELGVAVVELAGDHDLSTQRDLDDLLFKLIRSQNLVVVDISNVTFIDSSFIHGLLVANEEATTQGKTFRVQMGTTRIVERAIQISHIADRIEFVETRDDALARPDADTPAP